MKGTIYALKGANQCDVRASLSEGEGRFGWSYVETADLRQLRQRIQEEGWDSLSQEEKNCYQSFLLDLQEGDYVVYVNLPSWGRCTVAKVTGSYQWRFANPDFNHRFPVDPASVYEFDRNDAIVHPALRRRLSLQGRWWRIRLQREFESLLDSLRSGILPARRTPEVSMRHLSNELQPHLSDITKVIHHTHPSADLEALLERVFQNVPGVEEVHRQGRAGDHGADILVTFRAGLPISGLENERTAVVQVKSFEGEHWDTQAVEDIRRAFEHHPEASMGLIISTASASTKMLDEALDKLKEESGKPVALLIGPEVAAFFLRFGAQLLA